MQFRAPVPAVPPSQRILCSLAALIAGLGLILASSSASAEAHKRGSFNTKSPDGVTYSLYVPPSYRKSTGARAIVFLHGAGDTHSNALKVWKGSKIMPDWICIAVNARARRAWRSNEVDRVIDVLDEVEKNYAIDRTFVGGFSRGGGFAYTVGLSEPERFAGIVCLSGSLWSGRLATKELADALPIAIIHGEDDPVVPLDLAREAKETFEEAGWDEKLFLSLIHI